MSVEPVGAQPSSSCVIVLCAGMSIAKNMLTQPKWPNASSGAMEATGTLRPRPITSAI